MLVRKTTVTENRKRHVYLEVFRDEAARGKKARPLARFGPVDPLAGDVDELVKGLRKFCQQKFFSAEEISVDTIRTWGPLLIARHLWEEMGAGKIVSSACGAHIAEVAFALTANRLVEPDYQYGMDEWIAKSFLGGAPGRGLDFDRLRKRLGGEGAPVGNLWDVTLRKLAGKRRAIERRLVEIVKPRLRGGDGGEVFLYEVGTVFVEGASSRRRLEGRLDQAQRRSIRLFVGAITCGDWPISLRLFGGSEPSAAQIKRFVEESRRLGFQKLTVVLPSGVDDEKLLELSSLGLDYLVGVRRRRDPRAVEAIQEAGPRWVKMGNNTKVQEVLLPVETDPSLLPGAREDQFTERYILVHGTEEEKEERTFRIAVVRRALRALEQLRGAVESGRLKKPATIMARAERILAERKAYRYISWRMTPEGRLLYWEDRTKSAARRNYEGISLLKTSDADISPSGAVVAYDRLRRLEQGYNRIYDTVPYRSTLLPLPELEACPTDERSEDLFTGHLLISWLAFLLRCLLEERLREKKIGLPLEEAVEALRTISLAELRIGNDEHFVVSPGNRMAERILRALGIGRLLPTAASASTKLPSGGR